MSWMTTYRTTCTVECGEIELRMHWSPYRETQSSPSLSRSDDQVEQSTVTNPSPPGEEKSDIQARIEAIRRMQTNGQFGK